MLNVSRFPSPSYREADLDARVGDELARFRAIWESIHANVRCQIIQNNFELPPFPALGNLDSTAPGGHTRFIYELTRAFARHASEDKRVLVHDLHAIAARMGLGRWFDWERWYSYKILTTPEGSFEIASSLASQIGAMRGRARKVLVLDLDNTLWGGVIGDDGVDRLQIGKETALSEAYTAFQHYCLSLRDRGVLLAVWTASSSSTTTPPNVPSSTRSARWSPCPRSVTTPPGSPR